jgi:hypothetical protein
VLAHLLPHLLRILGPLFFALLIVAICLLIGWLGDKRRKRARRRKWIRQFRAEQDRAETRGQQL